MQSPPKLSSLAPCNLEEADSWMILHLQDAVNVGYKKVILRTVDTDVVVLAVAEIVEWSSGWLLGQADTFGTSLGPDKSGSLPTMYTGCDMVSSFGTRGKKSAWETFWSIWRCYSNFPGSVLRPSSNNWLQCCRAGALHHFAVWPNQRPHQHRWSSKGAVHQEKESYPTNTRYLGAAHQEGSLPG